MRYRNGMRQAGGKVCGSDYAITVNGGFYMAIQTKAILSAANECVCVR